MEEHEHGRGPKYRAGCDGCKAVQREYAREYRKRATLKPPPPGYMREKQRGFRAKRSEYVRQIKLERGCADCGYRDHPDALEFDHLPQYEKVAAINSMLTRSQEALDAEIAKCDVVCANCHRIRTANRRA